MMSPAACGWGFVLPSGVFKYFVFTIPWDVQQQWSRLTGAGGIDLVYWVLEYGLDGTIRNWEAYSCDRHLGAFKGGIIVYGLWSFPER